MSFDDDEHTLDEAWGEAVGDRANDTLRRETEQLPEVRQLRREHADIEDTHRRGDCTEWGDGFRSGMNIGAAAVDAVLAALAVAVPVPDEEGPGDVRKALACTVHEPPCVYDQAGHLLFRADPPAPAVPGEDTRHGALARADALVAGDPEWVNRTTWPPAPAAPGSDTEGGQR